MELIDAIAIVQVMGHPSRAQYLLAMQNDEKRREVELYEKAAAMVAEHAKGFIEGWKR